MTGTKTIAVIVVAAGRGERASTGQDDSPKQYRMLAGKPVLSRSIEAFLGREDILWVVPVIHSEQIDQYAALGLAEPRLLPAVTGDAFCVNLPEIHSTDVREIVGRVIAVERLLIYPARLRDDQAVAVRGAA